MAIRTEPPILTTATGVALGLSVPLRLFNVGMAYKDERGLPQPYLAEALPRLDSDSWRVFPGGGMETIYHLRSNLSWHDGTPLTTDDFVFAWQVYRNPDVGVANRPPHLQIESVVAPDARTVVIRWSRIFPDANSLMTSGDFDFAPLPRHLLERPFRDEPPEGFLNRPYWTQDYVGAGPFHLGRWEAGAFLEAHAFDGHALGRPRIDRIRVVFAGDANTLLANLLAGEVHLTTEAPFDFLQGLILKREWDARDGGRVLPALTNLRYAGVQFRPDVVSPRAVLDLRVRKAIAHAIDKEAFNDALFEGQGVMAASLMVPNVSYYSLVERAVTRYPYNPRMTEQLMAEVGFSKGPDGVFVSPTEGRFTPENRVSSGANQQREAAILAASLRQAGIELQTFTFGASLLLDGQFRVTYPTLDSSGAGGDESNIVHSLSAALIPKPENRWTGQNRGAWSHPEYERLVQAYDTTLDRTERNQQVAEAMGLVSRELPWIPFYFNLRVVAHVKELSGLQLGAINSTPFSNVHEWEFQ